jgi:hypothetical protein
MQKLLLLYYKRCIFTIYNPLANAKIYYTGYTTFIYCEL